MRQKCGWHDKKKLPVRDRGEDGNDQQRWLQGAITEEEVAQLAVGRLQPGLPDFRVRECGEAFLECGDRLAPVYVAGSSIAAQEKRRGLLLAVGNGLGCFKKKGPSVMLRSRSNTAFGKQGPTPPSHSVTMMPCSERPSTAEQRKGARDPARTCLKVSLVR